ncbi:MAG: efflux RND transporter periplasmic adaptor subunit [Gammaproteobacteria bacterium]|nr:efflux RND transporter periplasmic adaptor subunit [Gammaproteobacteria bacterium]
MTEQTAKHTQAKHICYVDDSRTSAFVTRRMLEKRGYLVEHFSGADVALESVLNKNFDLLITDLMITTDGDGVNGDDLIRLIRLCGHPVKSRIPIIVVTGAADQKTADKLIEIGANRVLTKPLDEDILGDAIERVFVDSSHTVSKTEKSTPVVFRSLKDQLSTQIDKQQDAMIPTLSVEADIPVKGAKSDNGMDIVEPLVNPEISTKFTSREIQPINSQVDIPLVDDLHLTEIPLVDAPAENSNSVPIPTMDLAGEPEQLPQQPETRIQRDRISAASLEAGRRENETKADVQKTPPLSTPTESEPKRQGRAVFSTPDEVASAAPNRRQQNNVSQAIIDQYRVDDLSLKPLGNEKTPQSGGKPVNPEPVVPKFRNPEHTNPFMDEIEALFREEEAEEQAERSNNLNTIEISSPQLVEKKKEKKTPKKKTVDSSEDIPGSEPEWLKDKLGEQTEQKREKNPLMDLLSALDKDDGGSKKSFSFKTPSLPFSLHISPRFRNYLLAILAAVLILPALMYTASQQKQVQVGFVAVETQALHESVMVSGRVISRKKINVTSFFPGQIDKVRVREGQSVNKGLVLAELDSREARSRVNQAEAKLISNREKVSLAQKTLERLQRALEKGAVSRQMVEDAETDWKTESARQSLVEEELNEAKLQVERHAIVAPFDGMVASLEAQEGQWLAPPEPLLTLVDVSNTEAELRVDAADSAGLVQGQQVEMSSDAYPGRTWMEKIIRISGTTETRNSGNFVSVHVSLGSEAPDLKVGQQVDAAIYTASNNRALVVPIEAILQVDGQPHVTVSLNDRVHFVPVKTGIQSLSHIEIVQGVSIGQRVLLPGNKQLEEGQKISLPQP